MSNMPLTRSSTKADRLVSPLIPQKRKPGTSTTEGTNPEAPPDTEASADASADAGVLPPDDTPGDDEDTWSDVDQEDTPLSSMNDLIDQVLFLDNERQSPWTERGAPDKPRHWANQYVRTQQVIEPFSYKEEALISEKIQIKKAHLFPELYLQFRNQFALRSDVHRDYCRCTPDGFRGCLEGTPEQIDEAVGMMNNEFSRAFRLCIDPDDHSLRNLVLTCLGDRDAVERKFFATLLKSTKAVHLFVRENELIGKVLSGDLNPFIYFMQAYKRSYAAIWLRVAPLLIKKCKTEEQLHTFRKDMNKHYHKTGDILVDLNSFLDMLVDKNLFDKRDWLSKTRNKNQTWQKTNSNAKPWQKDTPKSTTDDPAKPKPKHELHGTQKNKSAPKNAQASSREKPSGWIPDDEFREIRQKIRQEVQKRKKQGSTPKKGDNSAPSVNMITLVDTAVPECQILESKLQKFLWDTGSSVNLVNDISFLHAYVPGLFRFRAANHTFLESAGRGQLYGKLRDGVTFMLNDVYFAPSAVANILSPNSLDAFQVLRFGTKLVRFDNRTMTVNNTTVIGECVGQLQLVGVEIQMPTAQCVATFALVIESSLDEVVQDSLDEVVQDYPLTDDEESPMEVNIESFAEDALNSGDTTDFPEVSKKLLTSYEWHYRLGHPGANQFGPMKQKFNLSDVRHIPAKECQGCMLSKPTKKYSKTSSGHTSCTSPFEILHVDVCGPIFAPAGRDGSHFFSVVVDRFSRFVHVGVGRNKSFVVEDLIRFIQDSYTDLRATHYPRQLRSDNGKEILNDSLLNFLWAKGIQSKVSHPHSSYQNGMAERMIRSVQDKARTLMAQSNVPLVFWPDAVKYAAQLLNWTPRTNLKNQIPVELWYDKQPARQLETPPVFHTFGCVAYAQYTVPGNPHKLLNSTVECAYLGPSKDRTGFVCYTFFPPHVFESQHVEFCETQFYFRKYDVDDVHLHTNMNKQIRNLLTGVKFPPNLVRVSKQEHEVQMQKLIQLFEQLAVSAMTAATSIGMKRILPVVLRESSLRKMLTQYDSDNREIRMSGVERDACNVSFGGHTLGSTRNWTDQKHLRQETEGAVCHTDLLGDESQFCTLFVFSMVNQEVFNCDLQFCGSTMSVLLHRQVGVVPSGLSSGIFSVELESDEDINCVQGAVTAIRPFRSHSQVLTSRGRPFSVSNSLYDIRIVNSVPAVEDVEGRLVSPLVQSLDCGSTDVEAEEVHDELLLPDNAEGLMVSILNHVSELSDLNAEIPGSYAQARKSSLWQKWKVACDTEMSAHEYNNTFTPVPFPKDHPVMGCRWVFVIKDSGLFKARLVAKGFTQVEGINYNETFSPVIRHSSLRLLLAIAAQRGMIVNSMDMVSAFLNGTLSEEIYMKQVPGYHLKPDNPVKGVEYVLKLNKSLYGLKQAPFVWNATINEELLKQNFQRAANEPCVYFKGRGDNLLIIALYVDDLLIMSKNPHAVNTVKSDLSRRFRMKDLGQTKKFVGINVDVQPHYIKIHLADYIASLLHDYDMTRCSKKELPASITMFDQKFSDVEELCDETQFRSIIGKLLYAANTVRFDINYIVLRLSRHLSSPKVKHLLAAKRVIRYLKGTADFGIVYHAGVPQVLRCYSDADFASDPETNSRSITGMIVMYGGSPVSWKLKLQTLVSLSTVNAEMVALCTTLTESIWLHNFLNEFGLKHVCEAMCDNQGAIKTAKNGALLEGTKHIRVRIDFVKQQIDKGDFKLSYVRTDNNIADLFTKPLTRVPFVRLRTAAKLVGKLN